MTATYGLTFGEMILRVAEELGLALEATDAGDITALPSDAAELDKIKRAINDGLMELARAYPRWKCLRRNVSVTALEDGDGAQHVDGDSGRILVPSEWELYPQGKWGFRATGIGRGITPLKITNMHEVAALQATDDQTGLPCLMAIAPLATAADMRETTQRQEIRLWPKPDRDIVVLGMARVRVSKLVNLGDRSPFGAEHDLTLVRIAVREMRRTHPDLNLRAWHQADAQDAINKSILLDHELALPELERIQDGALTGDDGVPSVGEQVFYNGSEL